MHTQYINKGLTQLTTQVMGPDLAKCSLVPVVAGEVNQLVAGGRNLERSCIEDCIL